MLTTTEKIRVLLKRKDLTSGALAEAIGSSRQNLANKLTRNNFSEKDLREIATALGCNLEINFVDNETKEII